MVANTGTYVDSPFHRCAEGNDVAQLPLEWAGRAIGRDAFPGLDLRGKAVLVQTGWRRRWRTDAWFEGQNIDDTDDWSRPVHSALLNSGIPICEHMCNLGALPSGRLVFSAVPVKVAGFGTFPVRAHAAAVEE